MAAQRPAGPVLTVPVLHECETVTFKWASNDGPFKAWLWTGTGGLGSILTDFGNLATPEVGFAVDLARGYEVQLAVRDAAGHVTNSQPTTILPGTCPPGINLRYPPGQGKDVDDTPPKSSTAAAPSSAPASFVASAQQAVPTPTFSALPTKAVVSDAYALFPWSNTSARQLTFRPTFSQFTAPEPEPSISSQRPVEQPQPQPQADRPSSITSSQLQTTSVMSAGSPIAPFVPLSSTTSPTSPSRSSMTSYYTSASSTFASVGPIQSEASTQEPPTKSNSTMIAGIVGGVTCAILFLSLVLWVFCRLRRQSAQLAGRDSEDDYVHFSDTASSRSFPPIYAAFRSDTNLAGRGAGGGPGAGESTGSAESEKADLALDDSSHPRGIDQLHHIPYSGTDDDGTSSVSPYDMGSRPILDPAILGRSAPKLPKVRPGTGSTWRSSFGAVFNWMAAPSSPSPGPTSAFRLGGRASSRRFDGEASETLTSVGVSRTNTIQTERSTPGGGSVENPPSYRASVSTFAAKPPLTIANPTPTTPTAAALAVLTSAGSSSASRTLFPRRLSDATTIKTSRTRRSVATFGAADLALVPRATLRSPTSASGFPSAGLPSAALSPGSEDSFGDIQDGTELAYVQPAARAAPSAFRGDLAAYQLPPISTSGTGDEGSTGFYGQTEGVVSRVSIGKFERPRTLMFTRNSLAASSFGASGASVHTRTGSGGSASGRKGEEGGEEEEGRRGSTISGKWSEWRKSLRRSLGGAADDHVGQAI